MIVTLILLKIKIKLFEQCGDKNQLHKIVSPLILMTKWEKHSTYLIHQSHTMHQSSMSKIDKPPWTI